MSECIHYSEGFKYQLRAAYAVLVPELADVTREPIVTEWVELDPDGTMRFRPGYAWDGASGPTYDSKSSMRPSLAHDGGYQLIRLGLLPSSMRKTLDGVFWRMCKEDKMLTVRAWAWFHLVRIFAAPAADASAENPILCAPCDCPVAPRAVDPIEPPLLP